MLSYLRNVYENWIDYPCRPGTVLNGYRLVKFVGGGSYGLTYLCREMGTGRLAALKHNKPSKAELGIQLLEREAAILRQLDHPRIPGFRELFTADGKRCLITDYVIGLNVEEALFAGRRRYSEEESLGILAELLEMMEYIHSRGIVHLDIRIPNVILNHKGLNLLDFGLARPLGDRDAGPFPDEETRMRRTPAVSSDLYAAGHFLLFLLYSMVEDEPGKEQASKGWQEELPVSDGTKRLIRRLLQVDKPYANAREASREIRRLLER
ncbi:protein kinase [Paenibacillus sp. CC-CFT747]|nr:protein kinase [Paenibacillus sp. CC-CFT747]